VWESERAVVWHDLASHFVRAEYARAAGIDGAVAFPWFQGPSLAGVVTLLLSSDSETVGCVELWKREPPVDVLKHAGGFYVNAGEFERVSRLVQFPYAAGLPGQAWSTGIPLFVQDVRNSGEFVRAELAAAAGLARGISVPLYRERKVTHALTFLCGEQQPFVRGFELFVREDQGLVSRAAFDEPSESAATPPSTPGTPRGRELLAREARYSQLPLVTTVRTTTGPAEGGPGSESAVVLTLPIHDGIRLRAVACFEF
jgi:hypothetical protein